MNPRVTLAVSDEEIRACFPVMCQLRTHLEEADFVSLVRSQEREGYRLAYVGEIVNFHFAKPV